MEYQGLTIRRMTEVEHHIVEEWYEKRNKLAPPRSIRGDLGFMVERDGTRLASGYLLPTNTIVCFCEFIQTNPEVPQMAQSRALTFLVKSLISIVKSLGYASIMGFVPEEHKSLQKFYKRIGATMSKRLRAFYMEVENGS